MAAADSNLGAEILQQALASDQTQPAHRDRSASISNTQENSATTTSVATPSRRGHKNSSSVSFADGGAAPTMNAAHLMYNGHYFQAPSAVGATQVRADLHSCGRN